MEDASIRVVKWAGATSVSALPSIQDIAVKTTWITVRLLEYRYYDIPLYIVLCLSGIDEENFQISFTNLSEAIR